MFKPSIQLLFGLIILIPSIGSCDFLENLANTYAPVFKLHPREQYLPSSVDWYINRVSLQQNDQDIVSAGNLSAQLMAQWSDQNTKSPSSAPLFLKIPESNEREIRAGHLQSAVCYAHPHWVDNGRFIEINYILFFPFNGQAFTKLSLINKAFRHYGVGYHEGDFEHITVRLSQDGSQIIGVYYSAHANEDTWVTQNIPFDQNHRILSYVSLNTHAMYPEAKTITRRVPAPEWIFKLVGKKRVWTPLVDITSSEGPELDCQKQMTYLNPDSPKTPEWLSFNGRWGNKSREKYSSAGPMTFSLSGWYNQSENPEQGVFQLLNLGSSNLITEKKGDPQIKIN